jgi:hypothetical protein
LQLVAAAGCRRAAHCTPVPYDNHSCKHRQYSHMVAYAVCAASVSVADKKTLSLVCIKCRDSTQLGMTSLPMYTIFSLAQTLHRSRRRGTRLALECFHPKQWESAIQRRAGSPGMAPAIAFEPHSIARASLEPSASPTVRRLISQQ